MTKSIFRSRADRPWGSAALALSVFAFVTAAITPAEAVTRVQKTFGKWVVTCVDNDNNARTCSMSQSQAAAGATQGTALVLTVRGSKDKPTLVAVVPTGISVQDGVTLNPGGDVQPMALPYTFCGPRVCVSSLPLDAKLLAALKAGQKLLANYVLGNKKLVQVNVDLASFGDAYAYLVSQSP